MQAGQDAAARRIGDIEQCTLALRGSLPRIYVCHCCLPRSADSITAVGTSFQEEQKIPAPRNYTSTPKLFDNMPLVFNDPAHWRARALEAKALADKMTDAEGRSRMISVAQEYDHLADRATARLKATAVARVGSVVKQ
jgi:hypothetical protein